MSYNDVQKLAIAQAFYNAAGKMVSTKDPDSLRSQVDEYFAEQYFETGSKSFDVNLNGETVGTYTIKFSKPTQEQTVSELVIDDFVDLAKWSQQLSDEELRLIVESNLEWLANQVFKTTGEIPMGCHVNRTVISAKGKEYAGGMLKVDAKKVVAQLPTVPDYLLLGDA